ncbi:MAG: hypothetical protein M0C28_26180 [Candidatus Moduliflexus flocculans]|nr:hypothetical protein [Candidatus Moduliflexus flocculans]
MSPCGASSASGLRWASSRTHARTPTSPNARCRNADFEKRALAAQQKSIVLLANGKGALPLAAKTKVYLEGIDPQAAGERGLIVATSPDEADVCLLRVARGRSAATGGRGASRPRRRGRSCGSRARGPVGRAARGRRAGRSRRIRRSPDARRADRPHDPRRATADTSGHDAGEADDRGAVPGPALCHSRDCPRIRGRSSVTSA